VEATRSAFDYFAMDFPEDLERHVVAYLELQRSGKRMAPPKKYDNFGYNAKAVRTGPIVANYCKFFGVKQEQTRLIDTKTGL
jgi:hypothetical protein